MVGDGVTVREATLLDAEGIGLIHRLGLHSAFAAEWAVAARQISAHARSLEWREWLRARSLGRAPSVVLVAETLHGLAGFLCAVAGYPPRPAADWRLAHFYVLPTHRGQGLASRMLTEAIPRVAGAGGARLALWCPADASIGRAFVTAGAEAAGPGTVFIDHDEVPVQRYLLALGRPEGA